ncbi:MAG: hypothetical protein ABH881_03080 [bacterium]
MPDFQETINLRERMKNANSARPTGSRRVVAGKNTAKAQEIDRLYEGENKDVNMKKDLQKISRPVLKKEKDWMKIVMVLMIIILIASFGYVKYKERNDKLAEETKNKNTGWYSIKLIDENIYYGQVEDTTSDPVVIKNVYYNYDQLKKTGEVDETGKLRLVKRGQETHGPDGTMDIIRSQILFMEPLREDSKVLEAIRNNEKQ